jgi:flagellar protein FliS
MAASAQDAYLESRILSASPVELIEILYEAALEAVERARRHLREGDIAARSREISRACAIVVELAGSVKQDADPGLGRNLVELYDYMHRRLIEANCAQADAPLAEVARLTGTLLEGWMSCRPSARMEAPVDVPPMCYEDPGELVTQSWMA